MRTFLAFELPKELKVKAIGILESCRQTCPNEVRWVDNKNLHFTVQFFGDVTREQLKQIEAFLEESLAELTSIYVWSPTVEIIPPQRNRLNEKWYQPRLVWIDYQYKSEELKKYIYRIRAFCNDISIIIDSKPFKMHTTLGRVKKALNEEQIRQLSSLMIEDNKHRINEATLYESRLYPSGAEYIRLRTFKLQEEDNGQ